MKNEKFYALFDFADTIAELSPKRYDIVSEYINRICGLNLSHREIAISYKAAEAEIQYSSLTLLTKDQRSDFYIEFNTYLLESLGVLNAVTPRGLLEQFENYNKHWILKNGAKEILIKLYKNGYKIGILSNFDSNLDKILSNLMGNINIIDYIYISQNEGIEKPDLEFYNGFFKKNKIPKEKSFYVGDSYLLDYLPATRIGLESWLLDEIGLYEKIPRSLQKLDDLLNKLK